MTDSLTETITASGHENVSGEHASTLEVTSDDFLTPAGDCILGIEADRVPAEFDPDFVDGDAVDASHGLRGHRWDVDVGGRVKPFRCHTGGSNRSQ